MDTTTPLDAGTGGRSAGRVWLEAVIDGGYIAALGKPELALLWCYYRHANYRTLTAWPSKDRLSQETGMHAKQVQRARKRLVEAGWLLCVDPGGGAGNAGKYRLALPEKRERPALPKSSLKRERWRAQRGAPSAPPTPNNRKNNT